MDDEYLTSDDEYIPIVSEDEGYSQKEEVFEYIIDTEQNKTIAHQKIIEYFGIKDKGILCNIKIDAFYTIIINIIKEHVKQGKKIKRESIINEKVKTYLIDFGIKEMIASGEIMVSNESETGYSEAPKKPKNTLQENKCIDCGIVGYINEEGVCTKCGAVNKKPEGVSYSQSFTSRIKQTGSKFAPGVSKTKKEKLIQKLNTFNDNNILTKEQILDIIQHIGENIDKKYIIEYILTKYIDIFIDNVGNITKLLKSFNEKKFNNYYNYMWSNSDNYWYDYFSNKYTDTWTVGDSTRYKNIIGKLIDMSDDQKSNYPDLVINDEGIPTRKQTSGIVKYITNNKLDIFSRFINIPTTDISEIWHEVTKFCNQNN